MSSNPNASGSGVNAALPRYRVMKIETVGFTNHANGKELLTPIANRGHEREFLAGFNTNFAAADAVADTNMLGANNICPVQVLAQGNNSFNGYGQWVVGLPELYYGYNSVDMSNVIGSGVLNLFSVPYATTNSSLITMWPHAQSTNPIAGTFDTDGTNWYVGQTNSNGKFAVSTVTTKDQLTNGNSTFAGKFSSTNGAGFSGTIFAATNSAGTHGFQFEITNGLIIAVPQY
jgi:hypothetical protein